MRRCFRDQTRHDAGKKHLVIGVLKRKDQRQLRRATVPTTFNTEGRVVCACVRGTRRVMFHCVRMYPSTHSQLPVQYVGKHRTQRYASNKLAAVHPPLYGSRNALLDDALLNMPQVNKRAALHLRVHDHVYWRLERQKILTTLAYLFSRYRFTILHIDWR